MNKIQLFEENKHTNIIIKTAGNTCNLACSYCFEQDKKVDKGIFTADLLENLLNKISKTCSIIFHGGEPLIIGKQKFSILLNVVRKFYPHKVMAVRIQSNGTLVDEQWIQLFYDTFKDLNIELAFSLDGTKKMNCHRIDNDGQETFTQVLKAFSLLKINNISAGMLSVITKNALTEIDPYIDLIKKIDNIKFVKINPLFNVLNNELTSDSITPMEYANFIHKLSFAYITSGIYKKLAIEPILSILQRINQKKSFYCNYSSRKCFNYLSIYPNGKIGPCDCFSVNKFLIGDIHSMKSNINNTVSNYINRSDELLQLQSLIDTCQDCDIKDFCMGGCMSHRYYFMNNKILRQEYCESKRFLFEKFKNFCIK